MPKVEVLLGTYNNGLYLRDLLESLLAQDHADWQALVRDDGSSDDSPQLLDEYAARHPDRFRLVRDGRGNLGVTGNFSVLLERSEAEYAMFCDGDDIWLPDKLSRTLECMKRMESQHGMSVPLLAHTDLVVVDEALNVRSPSYWRYHNLDPSRTTLPQLLMYNTVTGCTLMMNRALCDLASPIPAQAKVHDYWVALVASLFGHVAHLGKPTVLYRQHGRNAIGAVRQDAWGVVLILVSQLARALPPRGRSEEAQNISLHRRTGESLRGKALQGQALLDRFEGRLTSKQKQILSNFAQLPALGFWHRRWKYVRHGFWGYGIARNVNQFLHG